MYGTGFRVQDLELRTQGEGGKGRRNRFEGGWFRVLGGRYWVEDTGIEGLDFGFRDSGSGFGVWGSWFVITVCV